MTLDEALTIARQDAVVMAKYGGTYKPEAVAAMLDAIARAAAPFLLWLSESDAMLRSGRSAEYYRSRFARWEQEGVARKVAGKRQYLAVLVPFREHRAA